VRFLLLLAACGSSPDTTMMPAADMATPYTWTSNAQQFFATYCVSCHQPGGQGSVQDFRSYADVMSNSALIRCGVAPVKEPGCGATPAPRQFPIGTGPKPTDDERNAIVAWIDAGLPF
jgi:mono/diheme cytochrome c family protein